MSLPEFKIEHVEGTGVTFNVTPVFKTKYWCWAYTTEDLTKHVIQILTERWLDCPVKKYVDFTNTFVNSLQEVLPTMITQEQIKSDWRHDPIDIKRVSGYKNENV